MSAKPLLSRAGTALVPTLALTLTALGALTLTAPAAHAQAQVTFSGGNGTPLTITLGAPVTYTITTASATGPFFLLDAVGNAFANRFAIGTGTLAYRINNGAPVAIDYARSGLALNDITPNDIYLFNNLLSASTPLAVGDQVVLTAGTFTTTGNVAGAAPASGSFTTFAINDPGNRISANGTSATAVPEPGEWAMMGMLGTSVCGLMIRARRKATTKGENTPAAA